MIENWFSHDISDLKNGFFYDNKEACYACLICKKTFDADEIFPIEEHFYSAKKAAAAHIQQVHGGMTSFFLDEDKKKTGITEVQKEILRLVSMGYSDSEIAAQTQVAPATIRHTRFTLRERAKQAKLYLTLFELATNPDTSFKKYPKEEFIEIHSKATMVDERYAVTKEEEDKIIKSCFSSLEPLKLKTFSTKEKRKLVILRKIAGLFSFGQTYTEKEVSQILKSVYSDFVTLRRYLIEYGFMERSDDGSSYRLN